ncbi:MAG TPA: 4Fe-4S dicluster domain-containing protein [Candidatus Gallacutalibacter stercoravium]|nr:4Fe-4S dicluster domain-containing protein [Candidatus Gallacutalibacter stercoravium]
MQYDNDAKQLKYEVLKRVAELSFAGELEDKIDQIPYDIIPGTVAKYRCCVYREREIIRERVTMARGKDLPGGSEDGIVTVLPAACEGCPINRFTVTTNCQRCMAKKCVAACPFGAITVTGSGAYIDPAKCKECGRCAAACPYNAISDTMRPCLRACPVDAISMDDNKQASIKYDRCIGCGACTASCPFGAITDKSSIVEVIRQLQSKHPVYAMFAPAIEGQFGDATVGMLKSALKQLGFTGVYEVSLGADAVAQHEAAELKEAMEDGRKMTTSCCPAFVSMIHKHFPRLVPLISHTVSPMTATARFIRQENPKAQVVFIGPCIAKKQEITRVEDSADYVLTFEELAAMFDARGINPSAAAEDEQDGSLYGKGFAMSGGVSGAVERALEEAGVDMPVTCKKCNGAKECKKALMVLNAGRLPENIVEGMACENGCIAGPASVLPLQRTVKNREKLLKKADARTISENLVAHQFDRIKMD